MYEEAMATAEVQFGQPVVLALSEDDHLVDESDALAELSENRASGDFMSIDLSVRDYPGSNILGKVVLYLNPQDSVYNPAMLIGDAVNPRIIHLARLWQPYEPNVGFSVGQDFSLSTVKQTRSAGFGQHGQAGAFEMGHFGTTIATGASDKIASELQEEGDIATHRLLGRGLTNRYVLLGIAPTDILPSVMTLDTAKYEPGDRLPIYWHPSLETADGQALSPDMDNATRLLIGSAIDRIGQKGIDRAKQNIGNVIRGAVLV